ncbi:MAG: transposase [Bacteroidota bacterium]|nr:transposase [Bacteroidota bacterium]
MKKQLWGGHIWTSGYYANTVGQYGNEKVIQQYVQSQGKHYKRILTQQFSLFE